MVRVRRGRVSLWSLLILMAVVALTPAAFSIWRIQAAVIDRGNVHGVVARLSESNIKSIEELRSDIRSANATEFSADMSAVQVAINLIGFVAIGFSLYFTRQATKAATDATENARITSQKELRAYVGISKVFIRDDDRQRLWVEVKNFGQTPASVTLITTHSRDGDPRVDDHPFGIVEPGSNRPAVVNFSRPIRLDKSTVINNFIEMEITYEDIFEQKWVKGARYYLDARYVKSGEDIELYVVPNTSTEVKISD